MIHHTSIPAVGIFLFFLAVVLGISFYLGSKAKSAKGYYAAHGSVHWFVNGIAFAGDYLSAASFLGICGMIAFFGYDGFLYAIGFLAGWVVALFVIAEPLKKLGKFTFADALDSRFHSRGIKLSAAVSTLVVSIFYLIPQMVGAGALIKPLLGLPYWAGVLLVGVTVILIVVTAGMVSTTWVQFIKGSLLVLFCFALTLMILNRGLRKDLGGPNVPQHAFGAVPESFITKVGDEIVPPDGGWVGKPYLRIRDYRGVVTTWRKGWKDAPDLVSRAQTITETPQGKIVNGRPQGGAEGQGDLYPVGTIAELPGGPTQTETGPVSPAEFLSKLSDSEIITWPSEKITNADGTITTIYYQTPRAGAELLTPGGSPTFKGVRSQKLTDKLDFLSLMLALFCGTASLPHILIRYYTVKDQAAARKSTVVGIASIGLFYILTLYLGLGAMISGTLDPTDNNMAAPLLAKSFGETPFALISAIAFTTVLGTVSGLIMAASGAVAHDLLTNFMKMDLDDHGKVAAGKIAAIVVGIIAMVLGILFQKFNVTFLVGWAFNIAASANLPALVMLLFWRGTTKQGITAGIVVGMLSSLIWLLVSAPAYQNLWGYSATDAAKAALVPFSQPGLVTIPLGFVVLIVVSLMTHRTGIAAAVAKRRAEFEAVVDSKRG